MTLTELALLLERRGEPRKRRRWVDAGGSSIWLARVGGLSAKRQAKAPAKRGIWAFIWPNIHELLLMGAGAEGLDQEQRTDRGALYRDGVERMRKFRYTGLLWTHLDGVPIVDQKAIPGQPVWNLMSSGDAAMAAKRQWGRDVQKTRREPAERSVTGGDRANKFFPGSKAMGEHVNPYQYEVFVPKGDGRID